MYLSNIEIINYGPLKYLNYKMPFNGDGMPKPLLVVGRNGSGKSIFLSQIVNNLMAIKNFHYENSEIQKDKVYKLRTSNYISAGETYSYCRIQHENFYYFELISDLDKQEYEDKYQYCPALKDWKSLPSDINSMIGPKEQLNSKEAKSFYDDNCILYFPANRFEEPAWLNERNLKAQLKIDKHNRLQGDTNRTIIQKSPLNENQNWLYEVALDREIYEKKSFPIQLPTNDENAKQMVNLLIENKGPSGLIYDAALKILNVILDLNIEIRFGIGPRANRQLSIMSGNKEIIKNVFQLSTGQTSLLNLFLSILRDFDLSNSNFSNLNEVTGIVVIDEIDAHLHTIHQYKILPELIKLFPKVQFIITTHSPLFLLGLDDTMGKDNFEILNLPNGDLIQAEKFSEFQETLNSIKNTESLRDFLNEQANASNKPLILFEGITDEAYFKKALELLGREDIRNKCDISSLGGDSKINKAWKGLRDFGDKITKNPIIMIGDCDVTFDEAQEGSNYKKKIPFMKDSPIKKGIENLFTKTTINKVKKQYPEFIDITNEHTKIERGITIEIPENYIVNVDSKKSMCDWLCKNGTKTDFKNFIHIIDIVEESVSISDKDEVLKKKAD